MSVKVTAFSGGTAAGNQLWTANTSAWVASGPFSSAPVYVQAGVTSVFTGDALYQNTASSMWSPHSVEHFVVGT